MANGKKKGNRGERQGVAFFKEWTSLEFSRVPQSGGLRWHSQKGVTGDIICTQEGHFCSFSIEIKNYQELNFQHLIIEEVNSKISSFWKQCNEDALRAKKIPILLMRRNQMKRDQFFVMLRYRDLKYLYSNCPGALDLFKATPQIKWYDPEFGFTWVGTTESLKLLDYKTINKAFRKRLKKLYPAV